MKKFIPTINKDEDVIHTYSFFQTKFKQLIFGIIQYFLYQGYSKSDILYTCIQCINEVLNDIDSDLNKFHENQELNQVEKETLIQYPFDEYPKSKRGQLIGLDREGRVILKAEPGWIPRFPYKKIDTNMDFETWVVLNKSDL